MTNETAKEVATGGRNSQELGIGNYGLNRGYYLFGKDPLGRANITVDASGSVSTNT